MGSTYYRAEEVKENNKANFEVYWAIAIEIYSHWLKTKTMIVISHIRIIG